MPPNDLRRRLELSTPTNESELDDDDAIETLDAAQVKSTNNRKFLLAIAALFLSLERELFRVLWNDSKQASLATFGLVRIQPERPTSTLLDLRSYQWLQSQSDLLRAAHTKTLRAFRSVSRKRLLELLVRFHRIRPGDALSLLSREDVRAHDAILADSAANVLKDHWLKSHMQAMLTQTAKAFELARKSLKPKSMTVAVTEIGRTINHEMVRVFDDAMEPAAPTSVLVWCAILDERTCQACADRDGMEVKSSDTKPPIHPRCRCFVAPVTFSASVQ